MTTPDTQATEKQVDTTVAVDPAADTAAPAPAEHVAAAAEPETGEADAQPERVGVDTLVDRASIAAKFNKRRREEEAQIGFNGNGADPTLRTGRLTQEVVEQPEPPATAEAQTEAPEARPTGGPSDSGDKKFTLVVYDEPIEVTVEELARRSGLSVEDVLASPDAARRIAQKDIAAERRLEDKKRQLAARETNVREDVDDAPGNQRGETTERTDRAAPEGNQLDARTLAEKIQFGSPDEAAEAIEQLRGQGVSEEAVQRAVYKQQRTLDVAKAKETYRDFVTANADALKDPRTHAAMTQQYYDEVRKDLKDLGYPDDRIPKSNDELVETHRFHRINGQRVRDTGKLLADSKQAVDTWMSGSKAPPQPSAQPAERRVVISNDRAQRRLNAPPQPARTAVAPQSNTAAADPMPARKKAVQQAMKGRGQLVVT